MMENKKGQQMTLMTIIAIVLGLVVLIFLIYGFSTGWGNLWDKITGLGGGDVNIATLSTACNLACAQEDQGNFCRKRDAVLSEGVDKRIMSCEQLATENIVDKCSAISCPNSD